MDLNNIRAAIDNVDKELLRLFLERMALSDEVAAYKKENNIAAVDRAREREILEKVMSASPGCEQYAHHLFSTLIELSKARQSELLSPPSKVRGLVEGALEDVRTPFPRSGRIACQGIEGSNSQQACDKLFPRGNIMYFKNFAGVFDAVASGLCDHGVLPAENNSGGSVRAVYELLPNKKCYITRATTLWIRHELLALPGADMDNITEIYSHEQALGQCSRFISSLSGKVKAVPCENTAVAAKQIAESGNPRAAAISSARCAQLYGLKSLRSDIQDSDNNYTRFVCIGREPVIYAGAGRICVVLRFDSRPGALSDVLLKFAARGINITKLESCPVTGGDFEFDFIFEIDAQINALGTMELLADLERSCPGFDFLGCYSYE